MNKKLAALAKWMAWLAILLLFFAPITAHLLHGQHHQQHTAIVTLEHSCSSHAEHAPQLSQQQSSNQLQLADLLIACDYCNLLFFTASITSSIHQVPVVVTPAIVILEPDLARISQVKFSLARARAPPLA